MKSRNFAILIGVLGILVLIYVIQQLSTGKKTISETVVKIFPGFEPSEVSYISVFKKDYPDSGISFARQDTGWIVTSYYNAPGKKSDIEKIMTDMKVLTGELRSTNPSLINDFGLADNEALHLKFMRRDSTVLVHFLAGKGLADAPRSSFIRRSGSDTVYKADENFISRFAMWNAEPWKRVQVNRWIELKMTDITPDSIAWLNLIIKGKTDRFVKEESLATDTTAPPKSYWKHVEIGSGKKLDNNEISAIVSRISNMRANDLMAASDLKGTGLENSNYKAILGTKNSAIIEFTFGAMADTTTKTRYALVSNKPYIYKIPDSIYESIFTAPFKKAN